MSSWGGGRHAAGAGDGGAAVVGTSSAEDDSSGGGASWEHGTEGSPKEEDEIVGQYVLYKSQTLEGGGKKNLSEDV